MTKSHAWDSQESLRFPSEDTKTWGGGVPDYWKVLRYTFIGIVHIYANTHRGTHTYGCVRSSTCVFVHKPSVCVGRKQCLCIYVCLCEYILQHPDVPDVFQGRSASCGLLFWACEDKDERDIHLSTQLYTSQREVAPWLHRLSPPSPID